MIVVGQVDFVRLNMNVDVHQIRYVLVYLLKIVRCLINDPKYSTNRNETCQNGGQYLANNDISIQRPFLCICPKGFHGDLCQKSDYRLSFSFGKEINIPSSIYIYGFAFQTTFVESNP